MSDRIRTHVHSLKLNARDTQTVRTPTLPMLIFNLLQQTTTLLEHKTYQVLRYAEAVFKLIF